MLKGGVIMDVVTADQARIDERGTCQPNSVSRAILRLVEPGQFAYCNQVRLEKRPRSRGAVEHPVDCHPDV